MAFSQAMVDKRVTLNTKKENNSNWSKFVSWCQDNPEYAHDPRLTRFARLPEAIFCYVGQLMLPDDAGNSPSMNVAKKARAGISEFYKYNNDGYGTSSWCVKDGQGYGNPMTSPVVLGCFKGLQKEKKATHVTRRAAPMTKPMLKTLYAFLDRSNDTSKSFTLWFKAVTSLSCQQDPNVRLEYHEYTFHDRKTESGNDRTYRLHNCQALWDRDICAKHHFDTCIEHVETAMKHSFNEDLVFPQIQLSRKYSNLSASVFNWGHAMSEGSVINILNEVIATMLRDVDFCSTAHSACDVIMKYLLDSIYVAEEGVLADAMSLDRKHLAGCSTTWVYSTHEQLSELVAPNEDGEQLAMANVYKSYLEGMEGRVMVRIDDIEARLVARVAPRATSLFTLNHALILRVAQMPWLDLLSTIQCWNLVSRPCCTLGKALYAIREFIGVLMQDIDNTNYKEIVTSHEAVMMLYGRVDAISSVELAVTLSKKVVAVLTAGDVEVVACLGDFASHVLES
ncbi:hypothetical protein DYB35_010375 [Aphanomyces astaci]|uniref:Uncharacterized protein n=1 Tax=Aphanomyces astaci TaxID=112090 RepID=A0A3R6ZXX9_APHAT|nr:hypothetical protein DYB35_010375 [Aphanomyces astaci]